MSLLFLPFGGASVQSCQPSTLIATLLLVLKKITVLQETALAIMSFFLHCVWQYSWNILLKYNTVNKKYNLRYKHLHRNSSNNQYYTIFYNNR